MTRSKGIRNTQPTFRGWTKPGPRPDEEEMLEVPLEEGETLDALSGHWRIFQLRDGHRFSTDDILTAWYGTSHVPSARRVLDLGSGIGSVGMVAAWRLPGAELVTVEAQEESVRLATKSARYNGLLERYQILQGDMRDPHMLAGQEPFDLVLGSPPYFPLESGVHGDHPQKVACRFEVRGTIADYCKTASEQLAPGGWFVCVFPCRPDVQRERVMEGAREAGLVVLRQRPIELKAGDGPLLMLFAMTRRSFLPEGWSEEPWEEPALVIRTRQGEVHPEYARVKLSIGFPP